VPQHDVLGKKINRRTTMNRNWRSRSSTFIYKPWEASNRLNVRRKSYTGRQKDPLCTEGGGLSERIARSNVCRKSTPISKKEGREKIKSLDYLIK